MDKDGFGGHFWQAEKQEVYCIWGRIWLRDRDGACAFLISTAECRGNMIRALISLNLDSSFLPPNVEVKHAKSLYQTVD